MESIKKWIRSELKGFSMFDKVYLASMVLLQIIVFIFSPDSVLGIIAGLSGVVSVVLCAKGKIAFYFIGFVQTISYLFLAYQNRFYGEVIENIFYLVTMVAGIFIWKKNTQITEDGETKVCAKHFTPTMWILTTIGSISSTILVGYGIEKIGNSQAYTDAATNVLAVIAQILMVACYKEQWLWWLVIDLLCIKLWVIAGNWSMVAMYLAWTINCIYGWTNWSKRRKEEKRK